MKLTFVIDATEAGVKGIGLGGERKKGDVRSRQDEGDLGRRWKMIARKELRAYFAGHLRSFSLPCDLRGLPPFTRAVLKITSQIPYGKVKSYRWVAEELGEPRASRAVGNALARNPIPIIIPCHRVVRQDGTLGGFALGPRWKKRLLALESSVASSPTSGARARVR